MLVIYNNKLRNIIISTIGIYFLYSSCKYMACIEYMNNISNFYEYLYRKKTNDINYTQDNINTPKNKYENINENKSNNENKKTEPYVVINNNKQDDNTDNNEEFSELVFIDIGNYLNNLND